MGAGAVGDVSEDLGPVLELDPVNAVGKRLHHDPLHERGPLGHERRVYQSLLAPSGRPVRGGPPSPGAGEDAQPRPPCVSTNGPFSVIATVCSK
jgi:hypothetical protein